MIHIVNGDAVGNKLQFLEGEILVWREMYDCGPLGDVSEQRRAHFFEEKMSIPATLFIKNGQEQYQWLMNQSRSAEITLWFEHDRYDQTMLMYLLSLLSREGFKHLFMVSIHQYPCIDPFYGLGQLSSQQLKELYGNRKQLITEEQIKEAITCWKAYTSVNPLELEAWIDQCEEKLPYLKSAMKHHMEYFPSVHSGLNEVERLLLQYIRDVNCSFLDLLKYISQQRINDGLSDLHLAAILHQLSPLLEWDAPLPHYLVPQSHAHLTLTAVGLEVLQGKRDRFEFCDVDWWVGGVHLHDNRWRRNGKRMVSRKEE